MNEKKLRLVVIAGCQRSGTTLSGQILGAHPKAFLIDEYDGLYRWFDAWTAPASVPDQTAVFSKVIKKAALKYNDRRRYFSLMEELKAMHLILKAPNLTYHYIKLSKLTPKPVTVFPLRDSRSVVASMLKLSKKIPMIENQIKHLSSEPTVAALFAEELALLKSPTVAKHIKLAHIWNIKTGMYSNFQEYGLNPFVYKYEELVKQPELICRHLATHCGFEFDSRQLEYWKLLKGVGPGHTSRTRNIDKTSLNKWKQELSSDEISDINHITEEIMSKIGYIV